VAQEEIGVSAALGGPLALSTVAYALVGQDRPWRVRGGLKFWAGFAFLLAYGIDF
jgi:hypothetical protein